jgi:hypothetical protein
MTYNLEQMDYLFSVKNVGTFFSIFFITSSRTDGVRKKSIYNGITRLQSDEGIQLRNPTNRKEATFRTRSTDAKNN